MSRRVEPRRALPPILICAALLAGTARAQGWSGAAGADGPDAVAALAPTADGHVLFAGWSGAHGEGDEGWVSRVDRCGNVVWSRVFGGAGRHRFAAAARLPSGSHVLAGETDVAGNDDVWLVEIDGDGTIQWERTLSTPGGQRARAVAAGDDGGWIVAGETEDAAASGVDGWLVLFDGSRQLAWQRSLGGAGTEGLAAVAAGVGGGWWAAGRTDSTGAGFSDGWIVRIDDDGDVIWQRSYGAALDEGLAAISPTDDGGAIAAGFTDSSGAGLFDGWLLRVDAAGNVVWEKTLGGVDDDELTTLAAVGAAWLAAGYTRSVGDTTTDGWSVAFDSAGVVSTQRRHGGAGDDAFLAAGAPGRQTLALAGVRTVAADADGAWSRVDAAGSAGSTCGEGTTVTLAASAGISVDAAAVLATVSTAATATASFSASTPVAVGESVVCAATPGEVSPPGADQPLAFVSDEDLVWEAASASCNTTFNVYRGATPGDLTVCLASDLVVPATADPEVPFPGEAFSYVVTGVAETVEGSPGTGTGSSPRSLTPCP